MSRKEYYIKIRVTAQTKQLFKQVAQREGLDISKLLRTLIHNYERPFTLSESQINRMNSHFANTSRLGGLLNQIAFHLNSENFKAVDGKKSQVELDVPRLENTCKKLEREVQDLKRSIVQMCENKVV